MYKTTVERIQYLDQDLMVLVDKDESSGSQSATLTELNTYCSCLLTLHMHICCIAPIAGRQPPCSCSCNVLLPSYGQVLDSWL